GDIATVRAPSADLAGWRRFTPSRQSEGCASSVASRQSAAVQETLPGEEIPLHTHHGSEAGYVIQGAMIQPPGKEPIELKTGGDFLFARDVPHAGFRVVGNTSLKLFTVHVVDKGKPLMEIVTR
ncbi:MAG TPA: cupin domain-containing protein, partial [Ideonella sp.]|nr:cupin domain-containing protein [Ideonella sp.]